MGPRRHEGLHHERRHAAHERASSRRATRRPGRRRSSCPSTRPGPRSARCTARSGGGRATRARSSSSAVGSPRTTCSASAGAGTRSSSRCSTTGGWPSRRFAVGLARGCLEESVRQATDRHAFGRPTGAFEAVAFKLADMRVAVETGRLAYQRAAWLREYGRPSRPRRRRQALLERGGRRQAREPFRSTAATATSRRRRSPGSTGTRRRSRSARARARSSGWSSPATWACRPRSLKDGAAQTEEVVAGGPSAGHP